MAGHPAIHSPLLWRHHLPCHTYTIAVAEKGAPLVRDDVLVREAKERKAAYKAAQAQAAKQQEQLI